MGGRGVAVEKAACLASLCFLLAACAARAWPQRRRIGDALRRALRGAALIQCGRQARDPLDCRVQAEWERRRVQRARAGTATGSVAIILLLVWALDQIRRGQASSVQRVYFAYAAFMGLLTLSPGWLTSRRVDVAYSLAMGGLCASTVLEEQWPLECGITSPWGVGLAWSLWDMRVGLSTFWLTAVGASTVVKRLQYGDVVRVAVPDAFRNVVALFLFLWWLTRILKSGIRHELRAKDSGGQLVAVRSLLAGICDVVVELGEGFRMVTHSPMLADILLQGPTRSLEGLSLNTFIPEGADRETFERTLGALGKASAEAEEGACVFHTTLRDSAGSTVQMELFAVAFEGSEGRRHLLGMREFTDVPPMAPQGPAVAPRRRVREPPAAAVLRGTPATLEPEDLEAAVGVRARSRGGSSRAESEGARSSSSEGSRGGAPSAGRPRLLTVDIVKRTSLINAVLSWNVAKHDGQCCQWHAAVAEAQKYLGEAMRLSECDDEWAQRLWQCGRCGSLGEKRRRASHGCSYCKGLSPGTLAAARAAPSQACRVEEPQV